MRRNGGDRHERGVQSKEVVVGNVCNERTVQVGGGGAVVVAGGGGSTPPAVVVVVAGREAGRRTQ